MGGFGSGRRSTPSHYSAESCLRLDVRWLHRTGALEPGARSSTFWSRGDELIGAINHAALGEGRTERLVLRYKSAGQEVQQHVYLEWTPCNFGGARPWVLCPRCSARVAVLYARAKFYCRRCHKLVYASTRQSANDRGIQRAQAIRIRLGGSPNLLEMFPPKPKGMHWPTYLRLREESNESSLASMRALLDHLS